MVINGIFSIRTTGSTGKFKDLTEAVSDFVAVGNFFIALLMESLAALTPTSTSVQV